MNNKTPAPKRIPINGCLTVTNIQRISTNFIRVVFSCDKLLNIDPLWIGPHLKLLFPIQGSNEITFPQVNEENKVIWTEGVRERVRTYSLREFNTEDNSLTIDFVIHQKGVATLWAQQAKEGNVIGLIGMGAKCRLLDNNQLILLGDIAAMPAICYTLSQFSDHQNISAIIEVRDEDDKVIAESIETKKITWLINPNPESSLLPQMVASVKVDDEERVLFWGGMESSIVQKTRHHLKDRFPNLVGESIQLVSYWREGFAEGEFKHRE